MKTPPSLHVEIRPKLAARAAKIQQGKGVLRLWRSQLAYKPHKQLCPCPCDTIPSDRSLQLYLYKRTAAHMPATRCANRAPKRPHF
jgi:hypothetical protein